jgi:hypothetical protein
MKPYKALSVARSKEVASVVVAAMVDTKAWNTETSHDR